jgi:multidrug efflux pump subunit AcrB
MYDKFEIFLKKSLDNPLSGKIILMATFMLFMMSILMIAPTKLVLAKMLPGKDNDTFTIYVTLANGSSIYKTKQVTDCVVSFIQKEKNALNTEVFLGMGSPLDFAGLIKGSAFKDSENVAE